MAGLSVGRRIYGTGVASSRAVLPEPPAKWSYSALKDVETCPRRYVLSRADYPDVWDQHGYPRTPVPAAIKGDVVHGSLETIVLAMVRAGCLSTRSSEAVTVLRELGGYTAVAERVLDTRLSHFDGNPRIDADRREQLARSLRDWIPSAREQIQTYLNRMELTGSATPASASATKASAIAPSRSSVGPGDHPEQELVAEDLRLMGRVDLLQVAPEGAIITDFKTGQEDVAHHDQLRLYALLWRADTAVNPRSLPVTALVAAYPSHEVPVPVPDNGELDQLANEIRARVMAADAAAVADIPEAIVGEQCAQCSVRMLCDAYWERGAPQIEDVVDGAWFDLQGTVVREHGVKSWVIRDSRAGREVLVRTPKPSVTLPAGKTVRILGVRRTVDADNEDALIASLTTASEIGLLTT